MKIEKFSVPGFETSIEREANLYLLYGEGDSVLIDSGYYNKETEKLLKALVKKRNVKAAIISHLHEDHAGGIPFLYEMGVKIFVHKREILPKFMKIDLDKMVFRVKGDLKLFFRGFTIRLVHTPGHTFGHISPLLEEEDILFSGDTILGEGTPWVGPPEGSMYEYMKTLNMLKQLPLKKILPGHGPDIENPAERIEYYISHRLQREKQILDAMGKGNTTIEEITDYVYENENLPERVIPFARLTVLAHIEKLKKEGRVISTSKNTYAKLK